MTTKDLTLIQKYLATTSNRIRLIDEKLDKEILNLQDLNPTGREKTLQGESSFEIIDLQTRAIKNQVDSILWKVQSILEKK